MRDPKRIQKFCNQLARAWEVVPDWRFGQFMMNVLGEYQYQTKRDPFFPEDDEMIEFIEKFVGEYTPYRGRNNGESHNPS